MRQFSRKTMLHFFSREGQRLLSELFMAWISQSVSSPCSWHCVRDFSSILPFCHVQKSARSDSDLVTGEDMDVHCDDHGTSLRQHCDVSCLKYFIILKNGLNCSRRGMNVVSTNAQVVLKGPKCVEKSCPHHCTTIFTTSLIWSMGWCCQSHILTCTDSEIHQTHSGIVFFYTSSVWYRWVFAFCVFNSRSGLLLL